RNDVRGLSGCAPYLLGAVLLVIVVVWGTSARMEVGEALTVGLIAAAVVVGLIHFSIRTVKISKKERAKAQREKSYVASSNSVAVSSAESEANNVTSSLTRTYESSAVVAAELPKCLAKARDWLQQAEKEFKENAFGPFWDAIENAAHNLAAFDDN